MKKTFNTLAYSDDTKKFVSFTSMTYEDNSTEYTVEVMTNPSYDSNIDDYKITYKSFWSAFEHFKKVCATEPVGAIYVNDISGVVAIAKGDNIIITVENAYECGWAVTMVNGQNDNVEHNYDEYSHLEGAIKRFKTLAKAFSIDTVIVSPICMNVDRIEKIDEGFDKWRDEEEYHLACDLDFYCNDSSAMERYERKHAEE